MYMCVSVFACVSSYVNVLVSGMDMYLSTQLEVRHGYCDFSTSNDKNHKNKVEKTKEVVELILPNSLRESETERQREGQRERERERGRDVMRQVHKIL